MSTKKLQIVTQIVTSVNGQSGDVELNIPTVPDWAQTDTKPTYTAAEVGALPSDTIIPVYKAGTGISIADDGTISVTVAKIYSGTTIPDNSTGTNGDIYLQIEG